MIQLLKRKAIFWNSIFYLTFSLVFLHISICISQRSSAFNKDVILEHVDDSYLIFFIFFLNIIGLCKCLKITKYLFVFFVSIISLISFKNLAIDLNKVQLILLSFFLIVSYFHYLLLEYEYKRPLYNSLYRGSDLEKFPHVVFKVEVKSLKKNGLSLNGVLENWNENTCLVQLENGLENLDFGTKIIMTVTLFDKQINYHGEVITYLKGLHQIGIEFEKDAAGNPDIQWNDFFLITNDLGLTPELLF